jgi:hypothetical protein
VWGGVDVGGQARESVCVCERVNNLCHSDRVCGRGSLQSKRVSVYKCVGANVRERVSVILYECYIVGVRAFMCVCVRMHT